jgi:hypothetical protein
MFRLESIWIDTQVDHFMTTAPRTLIDIGSESADYRHTIQRHIGELYVSLRAKGIQLHTLDDEPATQPAIVQDITLPLHGLGKYGGVLAANILEHIPTAKLGDAIDNLFELVAPDGIVVVTVPFNLPRHDRPIDTMLRPTPDDLAKLVGHNALVVEQWQDEHYREPYISDPSLGPAPIVTGGVFRP